MAQRKRFKVTLPSGETVWLAGETVSEAFVSGLQKYGNMGQTQPAKPKCMTVKEFVETKYIPAFFPALKETTRYGYEQFLKLNIYPFLGDYPLDEVKVDTIQRFYNWMASASERGRKKDLNVQTIERVRGFTSRIFKVAQEMGLISDSPFKHTLLRINAEEGGHHNAMDDEMIAEIKQNIALMENEDERLFMTLLVFMGLRPEEVYGMRWEDLQLENNCGFVHQVVTYPMKSHPCINTPKTKTSARTILITNTPKTILMASRKESGFILGGEEPWCYSRTQRVRKRAFKKLGIKGFSPYDFRTTFATQAKESGQTSAQVADLLGHKDTRMVETIYARTRHQSVMKQLAVIERLNGESCQKN